MSTDRELLELAARAAGLAVRNTEGDRFWLYEGEPGSFTKRLWSPLTNDGDAFRLAVKLRMDVESWVHGDSACARVSCGEILIDEPHYGDDPERATRRAIVRAAAEIGKQMQ